LHGICLVLANGFYEWRKEGKLKIPMHLKLKSGASFMFPGLSMRQPTAHRDNPEMTASFPSRQTDTSIAATYLQPD
jgi:putative SOS response-associated peptidase YedK